MHYFKSFIRNSITFSWPFGLALILLFGIPRFFIVLQANVSGNYSLASVLFLLMWIAPFLLLNKPGRKKIGIKKPDNFMWLIWSFPAGMMVCLVVFFIGEWLYDHTITNWFVYISRSYNVPGFSPEGA